jgi:phage host-nuclease inhibitor protein Gam
MKKRIRSIAALGSRTEFERIIDQTVDLQLVKERLELKRDKQLLEIRERFDGDIADLAGRMEMNVLRAEKYAHEHREELLPSKKKSAETDLATFGFRTGNPTLVLLNRAWSWKKVIAELKELDGAFLKFIVTKETVDKDAIKIRLTDGERAAIGTRIRQSEVFFIDPKRDPADPQRLVAPPALKEVA